MGLCISVVRTGGVTGMRRAWELELHRDDEVEVWRQLIDACPWDAQPDDGTPDRYVYRITAGDRTVSVPERELRGPWREFTDRVRAAADASPRSGCEERPPEAG